MWNLIFAAPASPQPEWTWEATATIIQAVATIVALAGVGVTFYYSLRAERREHARTQEEAKRAREEAERSEASAQRAERAAALSIDTLARIAEAVEGLASKSFNASAIPEPEPERVRWSLEHFNGDMYMLRNVGTATAFKVALSADPTLMVPRGFPETQNLRPDDSLTFMALTTMGTRDRTIQVEWSVSDKPDAETDVWRYPLPPRPPRKK